MKWIALLAALALVPLAAARARRDPKVRGWVAALLALSCFDPVHLNLISEETYRGDSRGVEVTSVDLLVLVLALSRPRLRPDSAPRWAALWAPRLLYFAAVVLSFHGSEDPLKSFYSLWKLVRMFAMFSVLAGALTEPLVLVSSLKGLGWGVLLQGAIALQQKYLQHAVRVTGQQSHPNSLAMIVNFIAPTALALTLAGLGDRTTGLVVGFAAMCDVFSLCRGGMMMFVAAAGFAVAASLLRSPTPRKVKIVAGGATVLLLAVAKAAATILDRFQHAPKESEHARVLFNMAARAMADDHPFGVGINMYSWALSHHGYAARFAIDPGDATGIAHHIYWLTAAETGYFGLAAYLLLLATVLIQAARSMGLRDGRGDIAIGLVAGLTVTYVQGTAEWIARQTNMSYVFWMFAAVAVALPKVAPIWAASRAGAPK